MVAKSPAAIYERAFRAPGRCQHGGELAALSLDSGVATLTSGRRHRRQDDLRRSHGAVAAAARPVLNARGEVIGINSAYIDGFSGGTLGFAVSQLLRSSKRKTVPVEAASNRGRKSLREVQHLAHIPAFTSSWRRPSARQVLWIQLHFVNH